MSLEWRVKSGTGKYDDISDDGVSGTATDTDSLNDTGAYRAAGKMTGSCRIHRARGVAGDGVHDPG